MATIPYYNIYGGGISQTPQIGAVAGANIGSSVGQSSAKGFSPQLTNPSVYLGAASSIAQGLSTPNSFSYQDYVQNPQGVIAAAQNRGSKIGSGIGTAAGSIFGPLGSTVGGLFGSVIGGLFGGGKQKRIANQIQTHAQGKQGALSELQRQQQNAYYNNLFAYQDPAQPTNESQSAFNYPRSVYQIR